MLIKLIKAHLRINGRGVAHQMQVIYFKIANFFSIRRDDIGIFAVPLRRNNPIKNLRAAFNGVHLHNAAKFII